MTKEKKINKSKNLNIMLITNLVAIGIGGYFFSSMFDSVQWAKIGVVVLLATWMFAAIGYWAYSSFLNDGKANKSVLNIMNVGALTMAFAGVAFRVIWLGSSLAYAPMIGPGELGFIPNAFGVYKDQMMMAGATVMLISGVITAGASIMAIKGNLKFEGYAYKASRNLSLGMLAAFVLLTVQAHFAPGVFGLVNTHTNWTGLTGKWPAHLLMTLMYITLIGGPSLFVYFMVKKPEFKQAGERPAFVTTAITLLGVMLTIYMFDSYVIGKLFPTAAPIADLYIETLSGITTAQLEQLTMQLPELGKALENFDKTGNLLFLLEAVEIITGIQDLGIVTTGHTVIYTSQNMAYNISMFTITTLGGIAIANAPVLYWQKKVLHAHD